MKFTRKLIPALAMLVVSATMMSTASFAWFSMNRTVTATGMQATAVAPVNLQIKEASQTSYGTTVNTATLDVNPTGKLIPMSTATPEDTNSFYAVKNVNSQDKSQVIGTTGQGGTVAVGDNIEFQKVTTKAGADDGYYVDYTFNLKLSSAVEADTFIYLSKVTISDASTSDSDITGAVRVAFLCDTDGDTNLNCVAIYANAVSTVNAVKSLSGDKLASEENVQSVTTKVASAEAKTEKVLIPEDSAEAITVVLRVWIEGQDSNCVNANAGVAFKLDVEFSVVS